MEKIDKIKSLLVKFDALSPQDKKDIKSLCAEAGIKVTFRSKCADCYRDALMLLKAHYGVNMSAEPIVTASGKWEYLGNGNEMFFYRGDRYMLGADTPDHIIEKVVERSPELYRKKEATDGGED